VTLTPTPLESIEELPPQPLLQNRA
jgi:hypothetical protein